MGNCRTLGAIRPQANSSRHPLNGQAQLPERATLGPICLLNLALNEMSKPLKNIGITQAAGYFELRARLDKSFGLAVVFGHSKHGPCLYEFKVDDKHDGMWGVFGKMQHTSTFELVSTPRYLKGSKVKRPYYLPGDLILLQKTTKNNAETVLKTSINDDAPGALKLIRYLLNEGNQKHYKIGYLILKITPNGGGSGIIDLQPVIFYGGMPVPVGFPRLKGVASSGLYGAGNHLDLNYQWFQQRNFNGDLNAFVTGFTGVVTKYGVGGIKSIIAKGAKKVLVHYAEKEILSEVKQKFATGLAIATLNFSKVFATELWLNNQKQEQDILRAIQKGMVSFLNSLLNEAGSSGLDKLIPAKVVTRISERLARWLMDVHKSFIIDMATGLIDLQIDKRDPQKAMAKYTGKLTSHFAGMVEQVRDALVDYVFG
ncbi:MAG: hypothetical protein ACJAS1_000970 [Oleiphilaceae bacterium]|jgi:hypothetical protein